MAVQALGVRNLDAAQDELASRDQLMNVVTDANVNHVQTVRILRAQKKKFRLAYPAHFHFARQSGPALRVQRKFVTGRIRHGHRSVAAGILPAVSGGIPAARTAKTEPAS
jgi:hypothetical protein